ncbi:MAG: RNA polymerase sigma factor [Propionicimonas sp.]|nr:RNA polymerase sigma factor [Propionicimonas sp.]
MEHADDSTGSPSADDLGTPDGFSRWVEPHWQAMARLAARYSPDADDILADALAVAWRKRAQFDPARGTARNWLLAITADQRSKAWRRAGRMLSRPWADPDAGRTPAELARTATEAPGLEVRLDLRRAIDRLPAKQALAIDLHYYLGLGVSDMAVVMHCPEGTVKSHLSRARGRLRTQLGDDYR